jgi:hypothetical protein
MNITHKLVGLVELIQTLTQRHEGGWDSAGGEDLVGKHYKLAEKRHEYIAGSTDWELTPAVLSCSCGQVQASCGCRGLYLRLVCFGSGRSSRLFASPLSLR